jgi:hypothetical protein
MMHKRSMKMASSQLTNVFSLMKLARRCFYSYVPVAASVLWNALWIQLKGVTFLLMEGSENLWGKALNVHESR